MFSERHRDCTTRIASIVTGVVLFVGCYDSSFPDDGNIATGPVQVDVENPQSWKFGEFIVTPLARYQIEGRVLSIMSHWFFREASIAPIDFVMGWNQMSRPPIYQKLNIEQGGWFYSYSWGPEGPPIPSGEIKESSANMHLIPATAAVKRALKQVGPNKIVRLTGSLVFVTHPDGWHWKSSLTRSDSGDGACELMWVDSVTSR